MADFTFPLYKSEEFNKPVRTEPETAEEVWERISQMNDMKEVATAMAGQLGMMNLAGTTGAIRGQAGSAVGSAAGAAAGAGFGAAPDANLGRHEAAPPAPPVGFQYEDPNAPGFVDWAAGNQPGFTPGPELPPQEPGFTQGPTQPPGRPSDGGLQDSGGREAWIEASGSGAPPPDPNEVARQRDAELQKKERLEALREAIDAQLAGIDSYLAQDPEQVDPAMGQQPPVRDFVDQTLTGIEREGTPSYPPGGWK